MDIRYSSVSKTHLLGASSEHVDFSASLSVFQLDKKNYSVGDKFNNVLFISLDSDYSKRYCDYKSAKSTIIIVTGNTQYAHSSICSKGLGAYYDPPNEYNVYNDNDPGKRVSIAVR